MRNNGAGSNKSVPFSPNRLETLPINQFKLSDEEIKGEYPDIGDEELEKLKDDLITISRTLYNLFNEEDKEHYQF
jgi:hypothetical protein